jgi:hypothetical protein
MPLIDRLAPLSVDRLRAIYGPKGAQMTDAELEAIADRAYQFARAVLETYAAQRVAATPR